uniref:WPP domain-containing protein n=1 Tax=Oryza rufipogon TaxID=4529 RepID=A0A0E0NRC2_ORYRU
MATDELHSAGAPAGVAAAEEGEGEAAQGFSFSIWPPTQRTRDAVVRRLVDTLGGDTILCKRYGAVPAADAEPAARGIEAEAFDAAAASGEAAATASVEEGIKALQLYSKEVSRRLLDFVKSRSAAAAAAAAAPPEGEAPAAPSESEVVDPQPAE